jgi:hypothetical protein
MSMRSKFNHGTHAKFATTAAAVFALAGAAHGQWAENFDATAVGTLPAGWRTNTTGAGAAWTVVSDQANSAPNAVFTNDAAGVSSQFLNLPLFVAQGSVTLDFWRSFVTDAAQGENYFDGWTVETSINGAAFANIGAPAWILNGYNAPAISSTFQSDIGGQPAFSGSFPTWTESMAVIPANAGDTVAIRFRMASDSSPAAGTGVWIDDINVTNASAATTGACCLAGGVCQMLSASACASAGGAFNGTVACGTAAACPVNGACCANNGTCTLASATACTAAGGIYRGDGVACGSIPCGVATVESEGNDTKATANLVNFANPGDYIRGSSTASSGAGLDYFKVTTPAMPAGIYRNRLTIESIGPSGYTGSIRGLSQTAPPAGPWTGVVGTAGTSEILTPQTSTGTTPPMNQWYGFGKQEQIYYSLSGSSTTTGQYVARWTRDPVTPTDLGEFQAGTITISTLFQNHASDTDLWVYDGNFNAIDGYGNNGASTFSGAPVIPGSQIPSLLKRTYAPGTYYLALTNGNLANNKCMASDDTANATSNPILDFPNAVLDDQNTTGVNISFAISDSTATFQVPATRAGAFDINWYKFTVSAAPAAGACCMPDGTCQSMTGTACVAAHGTFEGASTICGNVTCPPTGACCLSDGTCSSLTAVGCSGSGGIFGGEGSLCNGFCGVSSIAENFDSQGTLPTGWFSTATGAGSPWTPVIDFTHSGTISVFAGDPAPASTQTLYLPVVNATGPVTIDFWSRIITDTTGPDGLIVQASVNGAPFANIGQDAWHQGPEYLDSYNFHLQAGAYYANFSPSLDKQRYFSGNYPNWTRRTASIPAAAGDHVGFRFVMNTDSLNPGTGVWIDDVTVTSAATGACCLADGTCQMLSVPACTSAGGVFNSAASCADAVCTGTAFLEVEPNENKANATAVNFVHPGDYIQGNTTGNVTTASAANSRDTFLVKTPALPLGIYRNRLTLRTSGNEGHTGIILGVTQTAAAAGTWPGAVGTATTTEATIQTSVIKDSSPPRMNQWYGFGKQERIYYRVTGNTATTSGTLTTSSDYKATWTVDPVTPIDLGFFQPGTITISSVGQGHTTNTDLWVYDGNLNAMDGYGNDGSSTNGGAPANDSNPSQLTRTYAAGTYYLAIAQFNIANNKGSPCDDNVRTGAMLDFGDALVASVAGSAINVSFAITDGAGTTPVAATRPGGAFEVMWYKFSVGSPCYANCDGSTQAPILNVADFTCFLQKYAAGDPYANCDSSTQPPVLNVADFTCFLQKYAAGCP